MPDPTKLKAALISVTCVLVVISVLTFITGFITGYYFRWRMSAKNIHIESSIHRRHKLEEEDLKLKENPAYITIMHNNIDSEVEFGKLLRTVNTPYELFLKGMLIKLFIIHPSILQTLGNFRQL